MARPDQNSEIETLLELRSILGNGPCMSVGCEGCACEMQMASDAITQRLKELGVDEYSGFPRPAAKCAHVSRRRASDGKE